MDPIIDILSFKNGKLSFKYTLSYSNQEDGLSVRLPAFKLVFRSTDVEDARVKARFMLNSFFDYWINKKGWDSFINQLDDLGFIPVEKRNDTLRRLHKRKDLVNLKLTSKGKSDINTEHIIKEVGELENSYL